MNNKSWDDVIFKNVNKFMEKPDEFIMEKIHLCPICKSPLIIQMGRYKRGEINMIGITIECKCCNEAIAIDSVEK